jgi:GMP synthase-like glutamine amidotransferase
MICIFDCGYDIGEINRADQIHDILDRAGFESRTFTIARNRYPKSPDAFQGFIITGSPRFPDDKDDWMGWLKEFIITQKKKPFLGICLGHQLLSIARGGEVEKLSEGRNFGYREVVLTDAGRRSPLFSGVASPFLTFFSHRFVISSLQRSAIPLAGNGLGVQAFQDGNFFGVQFHPDFSWTIARHFAERHDLDPRYPGDETMTSSWETNKRILINFANIVNGPVLSRKI